MKKILNMRSMLWLLAGVMLLEIPSLAILRTPSQKGMIIIVYPILSAFIGWVILPYTFSLKPFNTIYVLYDIIILFISLVIGFFSGISSVILFSGFKSPLVLVFFPIFIGGFISEFLMASLGGIRRPIYCHFAAGWAALAMFSIIGAGGSLKWQSFSLGLAILPSLVLTLPLVNTIGFPDFLKSPDDCLSAGNRPDGLDFE